MVAELWGRPHVNVVSSMEIQGGKAKVCREVEGGQTEVYEVTLPAVFGADKSLNKPRYSSVPGILQAKKKPFDVKTPADFGIDSASLNSNIRTLVRGYQYPPQKPAGKLFKDEPVDVMVEKVVKLLREEAKVL
jgi:electron transfer flavoprotein beta subunit